MVVSGDYFLSLLPVSPQPLQRNAGTHFFLYMYHLPSLVYINPRPSLSQQRLEAPGLTLSPLSGVWGRTRVAVWPDPNHGDRKEATWSRRLLGGGQTGLGGLQPHEGRLACHKTLVLSPGHACPSLAPSVPQPSPQCAPAGYGEDIRATSHVINII